jgi:prepilin-type processing-associated H-X9-DG protein
LPHLEHRNTYQAIDRAVSVYHRNNLPVRSIRLRVLECPSDPLSGMRASSYAGVHHDVEAPIDVNNNGVFFLNSRIRYEDVGDGTSHTLFIGEKDMAPGDLGFLSGTSATLRNVGRLLAGGRNAIRTSPSIVATPDEELLDDLTAPEVKPLDAPSSDSPSAIPGGAPAVPSSPLSVGGFASRHPGGVQFAFGDGSVRFLSQTVAAKVLQQLAHRNDGQLLDDAF